MRTIILLALLVLASACSPHVIVKEDSCEKIGNTGKLDCSKLIGHYF